MCACGRLKLNNIYIIETKGISCCLCNVFLVGQSVLVKVCKNHAYCRRNGQTATTNNTGSSLEVRLYG